MQRGNGRSSSMTIEGADELQHDALYNPLALFRVSGKTAVITGASGAYGRTIGIALASLGCNLLLASGSSDELARVAKEASDAGGNVAVIQARPDTIDDASAIIGAAVASFGIPDMLIVASGLNLPAMKIGRASPRG